MKTEQDIVNIFNDWHNNQFCIAELRRKYILNPWQAHAILFYSNSITVKEVASRLHKIKPNMHPKQIREIMS